MQPTCRDRSPSFGGTSHCRTSFDMAGMFDMVPAGAEGPAAAPGRRRQREGGAGASDGKSGKTRGRTQNNRTVAQEEIDGLEKMDVEQLRTLVPVLTKMVLNLSMRTRQVEAVTLLTIIIGANRLPVIKSRARVKAWIEQAQEMRLRKKRTISRRSSARSRARR